METCFNFSSQTETFQIKPLSVAFSNQYDATVSFLEHSRGRNLGNCSVTSFTTAKGSWVFPPKGKFGRCSRVPFPCGHCQVLALWCATTPGRLRMSARPASLGMPASRCMEVKVQMPWALCWLLWGPVQPSNITRDYSLSTQRPESVFANGPGPFLPTFGHERAAKCSF